MPEEVFLLCRYALYGVIALEVLLLPRLMSKPDFAVFEYIRAAAAQSSYMLLGSFSGYVYLKYRRGEDHYAALLAGGIGTSLIASALMAWMFNSAWMLLTVPCVLLSTLVEKRLQTSNRFIRAILFRPLSAVAALSILAVFYSLGARADGAMVAAVAYLLAIVSFLLVGNAREEWRALSCGWKSSLWGTLRSYTALIRCGFLININTILGGLVIFSDRFVIKAHYPDVLGDYSLAYNIAQFVNVGINSIAYVSLVKIGENLPGIDANYIKRTLLRVSGVFAALVVGGAIVAVLYQRISPEFHMLTLFYFIIALFTGTYYVSSVVSPVLLYSESLAASTIAVAVGLLSNAAGAWLLVRGGAGVEWVLLKTGLVLLGVSAINLNVVFRTVK